MLEYRPTDIISRNENNKPTLGENNMATRSTQTNSPQQASIIRMLKELLQLQKQLAEANREHAYLVRRLDELETGLSIPRT